MRSHPAPHVSPGSTCPETLDLERPRFASSQLPRLRRTAAVLAILLGFVGSTLAPTGASAFGSPELTCSRSWDLVQSLLKRHISFRGLDSELRGRAMASVT